MGIARITKAFTVNEKKRKSLIIYLSAGDPSLAFTEVAVRELAAAGVDMIELGVPFSDPVADGPIIQAASQRSLSGGTSLAKILDLVGKLRTEIHIPLVLMSYYNPLLQYGLEKLATDLEKAGGDGLIVPDLPWEESTILREQLTAKDLALIPLVAPNTPAQRLIKITAAASGFVYCVSLAGVTGTRHDLPTGTTEYLNRVRSLTNLPLGVGFGISTPEQAKLLAPFCDGIIVGSAVVKLLYEKGISTAVQLVKNLRQAI